MALLINNCKLSLFTNVNNECNTLAVLFFKRNTNMSAEKIHSNFIMQHYSMEHVS